MEDFMRVFHVAALLLLVCLGGLRTGVAEEVGIGQLATLFQPEAAFTPIPGRKDGLVRTVELDLDCYRQCVPQCQAITTSIADEQDCICESCINGCGGSCSR
jgi:hypothetical protein